MSRETDTTVLEFAEEHDDDDWPQVSSSERILCLAEDPTKQASRRGQTAD